MSKEKEEGFLRCNICDYCNENKTKFRYNKRNDEFLCDKCYEEIQSTLTDYEERDEYLGIKTDYYDDMTEDEIDNLLVELGYAEFVKGI